MHEPKLLQLGSRTCNLLTASSAPKTPSHIEPNQISIKKEHSESANLCQGHRLPKNAYYFQYYSEMVKILLKYSWIWITIPIGTKIKRCAASETYHPPKTLTRICRRLIEMTARVIGKIC